MSTIKYTYTYKEYEGFARASSLSHTLASIGFWASLFSFLFTILSVIMLLTCETIADYISGGLFIIVLIAFQVFLNKVYPKIADRIVEKVIEKTIERRAQLKQEK